MHKPNDIVKFKYQNKYCFGIILTAHKVNTEIVYDILSNDKTVYKNIFESDIITDNIKAGFDIKIKNMCMIKEEFKIKECFQVIYNSSYSLKDDLSHKNTFRNKYIGLTGVIYIIKNKKEQYFQWHPIGENNEILYAKGLVSSNDEYKIDNNVLKVVTENSIYNFTNINKKGTVKSRVNARATRP